MTCQDLFILYDYNGWANGRALGAAEALTPERFLRDLGNSFASVRDTLAHILGAEGIWLQRWLGEPPAGLPPAADFPSVASLRDRFAAIQRERRTFLEGLGEDGLGRPLRYRDTAGKPQTIALAHSLQHVVNHGTYHRGQVTTMLRQLGATPVSTDMSRFFFERGTPAK